ncbi:hypothetical protein CRV00_00240 [Malaciobacter molluscorum]|nr:hypothetical protein CRV00_00240 [Malaciobacter molluscorum]
MLNLKTVFFIIFITIFFSACVHKNVQISDLKDYSQNPKNYLSRNLNFNNQQKEDNYFNKKYFSVWTNPKISISKKVATWGFDYKKREIYLQNFSRATKQWFDKQIENSNFDEFKKASKKAIVIKNSALKVFPTIQMMFYNPYKAGEGFPFDYNQNSQIKINTPILISHFSKDKAWAFIKSASVFGWIKVDNIAFVDKNFIKEFMTNNYYIATKDKFNIYDNFYIEKIQLGTIFPKKENRYIVAKKDLNHNAYIEYISIDTKNIDKKPLIFNAKNISKVASQLIGEQYGWGGIFNFRDCSSFTQDFFSVFGKYLERNSSKQLNNGRYINIKNLTNQKKKEFIIKNAKPFKTLIHLPGHIMLYIGSKKDEPLVMHNVWGVKTRVFFNTKGRNIIGKNIISTLDFGKELQTYDDTKNVLDKIESIVILDEKR